MTINYDKMLLSEKIAVKMCHDLAGGATAVTNSIEMLTDDSNEDDFKKRATDIALRGAKGISAKIKFFRIAFGSLGQNDIDNNDLFDLFKNYMEAVANDSSLNFAKDVVLSAKEAKIIFNVVIFAMSVVGAKFFAEITKERDAFLLKIKNAKPFILPKEISLTDEKIDFNEITPANAPLLLGGILAEEYKKKMKINITGDILILKLE